MLNTNQLVDFKLGIHSSGSACVYMMVFVSEEGVIIDPVCWESIASYIDTILFLFWLDM